MFPAGVSRYAFTSDCTYASPLAGEPSQWARPQILVQIGLDLRVVARASRANEPRFLGAHSAEKP